MCVVRGGGEKGDYQWRCLSSPSCGYVLFFICGDIFISLFNDIQIFFLSFCSNSRYFV